MFKHLRVALVCALFPLAGCASISNGINSVTASLSSPNATQAAANLKAGAMAFVCAVNSVSAIASEVAVQVDAGKVAVRDTHTVFVVSGTLCKALGGVVTGTAVVPAQ